MLFSNGCSVFCRLEPVGGKYVLHLINSDFNKDGMKTRIFEVKQEIPKVLGSETFQSNSLLM